MILKFVKTLRKVLLFVIKKELMGTTSQRGSLHLWKWKSISPELGNRLTHQTSFRPKTSISQMEVQRQITETELIKTRLKTLEVLTIQQDFQWIVPSSLKHSKECLEVQQLLRTKTKRKRLVSRVDREETQQRVKEQVQRKEIQYQLLKNQCFLLKTSFSNQRNYLMGVIMLNR